MDVIQKIRKTGAAAGQGAHVAGRDRPGAAKTTAFVQVLERAVQRPVKAAQKTISAGRGVGRAIGQLTQTVGRTAARRPALRNITLTHAARLAYFSPAIQRCAAKYGVPVPLICGVMLQESGGNPKAVSHCGARGLMQLMPATARRMGVTNIMDPRQNIEGGVRYLRFLLDRFRGNVRLAVAAYNCGEGNVEKYGNRIPPFAETQGYVPNVLAYAESIHHILGRGLPRDVAAVPAQPTPASLAGRFVKLA